MAGCRRLELPGFALELHRVGTSSEPVRRSPARCRQDPVPAAVYGRRGGWPPIRASASTSDGKLSNPPLSARLERKQKQRESIQLAFRRSRCCRRLASFLPGEAWRSTSRAPSPLSFIPPLTPPVAPACARTAPTPAVPNWVGSCYPKPIGAMRSLFPAELQEVAVLAPPAPALERARRKAVLDPRPQGWPQTSLSRRPPRSDFRLGYFREAAALPDLNRFSCLLPPANFPAIQVSAGG